MSNANDKAKPPRRVQPIEFGSANSRQSQFNPIGSGKSYGTVNPVQAKTTGNSAISINEEYTPHRKTSQQLMSPPNLEEILV